MSKVGKFLAAALLLAGSLALAQDSISSGRARKVLEELRNMAVV